VLSNLAGAQVDGFIENNALGEYLAETYAKAEPAVIWRLFSEYLGRTRYSGAVFVELLSEIDHGLARELLQAHHARLAPSRGISCVSDIFNDPGQFVRLYDGYLDSPTAIKDYYGEWDVSIEYYDLVYYYSAGARIDNIVDLLVDSEDVITQYPGELEELANISREEHNQAAIAAAIREGQQIRSSLGLPPNIWD
jgi:hypothetical protein